MKTKMTLLTAVFFGLMNGMFLFSSSAYETGAPRTPEEQIKANAEKAKEYPPLREGRWDPKGWTPATLSGEPDNLAMKIIDNLNNDETLSKKPISLKVKSKNGAVTLEGVVNDALEKSLIHSKVQAMQGVGSVDNQLQIKTSDKDLLK